MIIEFLIWFEHDRLHVYEIDIRHFLPDFFLLEGGRFPPLCDACVIIEDMNKGVFVDVSAKGMFRG